MPDPSRNEKVLGRGRKKRKGKMTLKKLARKVANLKGQVEIKRKNLNYPAARMGVLGSYYVALPQIAQGDDSFERIGTMVSIIGLRLRGRVFRDSADTTNNTMVSVSVVYDKAQGDLPPLLDEIYPVESTLYHPKLFINTEVENRFKVIYRNDFVLDQTDVSEMFDSGLIKIRYNQHYSSVLATDYISRNLFLIVRCTNSSTPASLQPFLDFESQLLYTDL